MYMYMFGGLITLAFTYITSSVSLFIQVYEVFDLDLFSWPVLVAQLVRSSVRSAECRGFKSHLRQLTFHFFNLPQVPVFLFISSHHVHMLYID